ncbi:outer membrane protein [Nitratireductor sp. ZSWI3]|uniref:outer membrane protein n=1 Tax=Nitratireductor sp. ZSWI3 TaxID=2966359 RepID=UPI0021503D93|nr:outer membrane protein [Nitratireductor sp. ZSWI3]MCR4268996.1 porin family protein [Nitratireductor sp. ZSWI3]
MKTTFLAAALLLTAGQALAADPVVYEPAPVPPAVAETYDWTGPYIGVFGGLAVGDMEYVARQIFADGNPPPQETDLDISASGFLGGVQAGYDWQFAERWVIGAVADIAVTNYGASVTASINGTEVFDGESQVKYLGTVRARLGHAWDRTLVYAHGGLAYGKTELDVTVGGVNVINESQTRTGWTAGAGFEFAVTEKLSLGSEYAYVDLGSKQIFDNGEGLTLRDDVAFHTLKAFVNYRF